MPDCSNMCHESTGSALSRSLGIGKGSAKLEDFYAAEIIMIYGQNPGTNHPRMLSALKKAKKNGCTIISINPLKEAGLMNFSDPQNPFEVLGKKTKLTDIQLSVKINSDIFLTQAINKELLLAAEDNPQILDNEFIETYTTNFDQYKDFIKTKNVDELLSHTGIGRDQFDQVVNLLKSKSKIVVCWAMGVTQHVNSVETIQELVNLLLLKGAVGKLGAGTCPVRGHSNVQGDRTMGVYENPWPWLLDKLDENFGIQSPRDHGYNVVSSIEAMHNDKVRFFFAMGGNLLSAAPDYEYSKNAFSKCDMTVYVSTKLNRSHVFGGQEALILPALGRTDLDEINGENQIVSTENSFGIVQSSRGNLKPVSDQLKSEPYIVCELAMRVFGENSKVNWGKYLSNYDVIRNEIERTIPSFENYNQRVRERGGFYLKNTTRERLFPNQHNKALFAISDTEPMKIADDELLLMTLRSHDQYNTTIYGLNDRYRGIKNLREIIFLNKKDLEKNGIQHLDRVDVVNMDGGLKREVKNFVAVAYDIPEQCAAMYFPEGNALVPITAKSPISGCPASKSVVVKINKSK